MQVSGRIFLGEREGVDLDASEFSRAVNDKTDYHNDSDKNEIIREIPWLFLSKMDRFHASIGCRACEAFRETIRGVEHIFELRRYAFTIL